MSLLDDLQQFTGTVDYHRHPMYRFVMYTDGVRHFFRHAGNGGYWMLDLLATEPRIRIQAKEFASIKLRVQESKAVLTVNDGNDGPNVYERHIEYTDCPEGEYLFYWIGEIIMLAREY